MYNHVRLLFQAKRILAGKDLILNTQLNIEQEHQVKEERELLLKIREGDMDEEELDQLIADMVSEFERAVESCKAWKEGVRAYNVPYTLLDRWIVQLRRRSFTPT